MDEVARSRSSRQAAWDRLHGLVRQSYLRRRPLQGRGQKPRSSALGSWGRGGVGRSAQADVEFCSCPGHRGDRRDLLGPQARGPAALPLDQRFAVHERDARVSMTRCSNGLRRQSERAAR
jgi:hypothetical protein